jgi:sorbitol-specific phosphotransferase system component IIA
MRVKIGNEIFDSLKEPVMIIFDEGEQEQISKMKELKKYCSYPTEGFTVEEIEEFMG